MESALDPDVSLAHILLSIADHHHTTTEPQGSLSHNHQNNVSYIYRQDIVRSKINNKTGIVAQVAGDSESDTSLSDEEDEDDDVDEDDQLENDEIGDADDGVNEYHTGEDKESPDKNSEPGNHNNAPLPADQVRVLWMDESETTENINDVIVVDRSFLHGDYVASASNPTGQVGLVVDVNLYVDLQSPDGYIMADVSSRELKRVRDFTVGDYVVLDSWLGRIEDVLDNVTVLFDDGSVCKVLKADPLRLKAVGKKPFEDGHFPYYPGQRVKAISSSVFKNSRWLSGLWKANRMEGTVTKVTVASVFIYWIASAGYGPDSSNTPAEEQSPKNLKLLSCFAHANWQLGDWCLLPSQRSASATVLDKNLSKLKLADSTKEESEYAEGGDHCDSELVTSEESNVGESMEVDVDSSSGGNPVNEEDSTDPADYSSSSRSLPVSKDTAHENWPLHRKKMRKVVFMRDKKLRKKEENFERALPIMNTKTKVDVAWQDGTIEQGRESTSLIPVDTPGDYEFVAEQYVIEKVTDEDDNPDEVRRVGVVKSVNAKDRTACVRWIKPVQRAEDPRQFDKEEIVSVYELEGHPDYDYCYGDVVVRLSPVSMTSQMVNSAIEDSKQMFDESKLKQDKKLYHDHEGGSTDETGIESALSWVGNITGLRDGDIEVTWADGMISTVGPQAIYVVGRDDDESIGGSEVSNDAASWETVEDDEMDFSQNDREDPENQNASLIDHETEESTRTPDDLVGNGALTIPLAALGFVTRIASGIFSRGKKHIESSSMDSRSEDEIYTQDFNHRTYSSDEPFSQDSDGIVKSTNLLTNKKEEQNRESKDLLEVAESLDSMTSEKPHTSQCENGRYDFKGFDITEDPSGHHFIGAVGQTGRKWLKKVQQDWNILQNNLPDGIYVRVYEDRMDLIRAVVVGAYGTPYQDGMFFFDFHLPPENSR
ncbi:hypothetical protein Leryth_019993 [Lithospermum erythrorhizon]|nr:hypothetical protein Leryth_019993 [Lithospermum erythrorhizon]